jgi:glycyl-tRNA synthetase beta chain
VDENKFVQEEEKELYRELLKLEQIFKELPVREQVERLASLKGTIDKFFDNVMVMAKEEDLRRNRIALLQRVKKLFENVANFDKISVEKTSGR